MAQGGYSSFSCHIPFQPQGEGAKKGILLPIKTLPQVADILWLKLKYIETLAAREARKYILYSDSRVYSAKTTHFITKGVEKTLG